MYISLYYMFFPSSMNYLGSFLLIPGALFYLCCISSCNKNKSRSCFGIKSTKFKLAEIHQVADPKICVVNK